MTEIPTLLSYLYLYVQSIRKKVKRKFSSSKVCRPKKIKNKNKKLMCLHVESFNLR